LWCLQEYSLFDEPTLSGAAAHPSDGGRSDDCFDYFRGWLIAQGREVLEHVVADPDALAELPVVQASTADGVGLEGEDVLSIP
jgi:hypothetical protein